MKDDKLLVLWENNMTQKSNNKEMLDAHEKIKKEWLKMGYLEETADFLTAISVEYVQQMGYISPKEIAQILKEAFDKRQ